VDGLVWDGSDGGGEQAQVKKNRKRDRNIDRDQKDY
jgi:hypothetical protein